MQILEDHEQRLLAGFPKQQFFDSIEGVLAALAGLEHLPRGVVHGQIEQRQQRRQRRLKRTVEREQLARHLLADLARVVSVLDLQVALEEVDHRQVAHLLAVGDRCGLGDQPALQRGSVDGFVNEARLADPRLADDCHYLAKPVGCQLLRTMKLLQFSVAADESRETALSSSLQTCPRRARARHLVDLHWAGQAPDRQGAQWLHGDETFGELQGKTSAECCPGSPTAPSALRDGSSGRRPCSPCGDRCQWTARPPRLS